jgi:hypothetical protein
LGARAASGHGQSREKENEKRFRKAHKRLRRWYIEHTTFAIGRYPAINGNGWELSIRS